MIPAEVADFTTSGERTVYNFLRRAAKPDSSFLAWYSPDIEDREPDFVLLSPDSGLIVLEVKDWLPGQILEADPKTALLDVGGVPTRRKQPLAQAREYVNSLLNLLGKNCGKWKNNKPDIPCPITWGAVFPHMRRESFHELGLEKVSDGKRILFWNDIHEDSPFLRDASGQKLRQWLLEHFPPLFAFSLSPTDINWIRNCIFPVARIDLPREASAQRQTVAALDLEQENMARDMAPGKTLIEGPAGSGKTLVLAHQAWNLPRVNRNIHRVLVTCFNLSLIGYIRRLLAKKGAPLGRAGVETLPFYTLCERILSENLPHSGEEMDYYELVVRESLERLSRDHPLKGYWDAILVDEGQDFSPEMARVILSLLPENGVLVVAVDDSQRLYQKHEAPWKKMGISGLRVKKLHTQYRNTKPIATLAFQLLGNTPVIFAGANGEKPGLLRCDSPEALARETAERIGALVRAGLPMREIAVLYTSSEISEGQNLPLLLQECLEAQGVLARWIAKNIESKRNFDITTDSVTISTIHSAKGLDFAHVFLLGLDSLNPALEKHRNLAHVGITRARENLTLGICNDCWLTDLL